MLSLMDRIGKIFDILARRLTQISVAVMAVAVTAQVIWRYFLGNPIIWAEELARYALVWMTFIGAAVALRSGQLAAMDLVVTRFPPGAQRWINVFVSLVNCVLLAFLLYCSINLVGMPSVVAQKSPAMRVPMSYVYMALPIGMGLLLLQSFFRMVTGICRKGE
jgi:TRAP-type C4-dicarboxylate transport system permease small subunit